MASATDNTAPVLASLRQPPRDGSMEGEESLAEHYRKRAAKAREIISKSAADPALLQHLESVAREYDRLADRFEAESSGKPKTD